MEVMAFHGGRILNITDCFPVINCCVLFLGLGITLLVKSFIGRPMPILIIGRRSVELFM